MVVALARVSDLTVVNSDTEAQPPRMSAAAVVGEMRLFVPLKGIVDPDAEIARLQKEIGKLQKESDTVEKKLANESFLAKAHPEAVQKQKDRQAELSGKLLTLREGLDRMESLKGA